LLTGDNNLYKILIYSYLYSLLIVYKMYTM